MSVNDMEGDYMHMLACTRTLVVVQRMQMDNLSHRFNEWID